jgi:hypothetical protein
MRFARGLVRTRVAQRLFVLFVLSAFLPLAAIGVLSFVQVKGTLLQQGELRLAALAKTYGMTLFERMTLAADIGAATAANRPRVVAETRLPRARSAAFPRACQRECDRDPRSPRDRGVAGPGRATGSPKASRRSSSSEKARMCA